MGKKSAKVSFSESNNLVRCWIRNTNGLYKTQLRREEKDRQAMEVEQEADSPELPERLAIEDEQEDDSPELPERVDDGSDNIHD